MRPGGKWSPNKNFFDAFLSNTSKLPKKLTCLYCPMSLNTLHACTNEFEESTDGIKATKLACQRCNKTVWICDVCDNEHACESKGSLKLHNLRFHNVSSTCNDRCKQKNVELDT